MLYGVSMTYAFIPSSPFWWQGPHRQTTGGAGEGPTPELGSSGAAETSRIMSERSHLNTATHGHLQLTPPHLPSKICQMVADRLCKTQTENYCFLFGGIFFLLLSSGLTGQVVSPPKGVPSLRV